MLHEEVVFPSQCLSHKLSKTCELPAFEVWAMHDTVERILLLHSPIGRFIVSYCERRFSSQSLSRHTITLRLLHYGTIHAQWCCCASTKYISARQSSSLLEGEVGPWITSKLRRELFDDFPNWGGALYDSIHRAHTKTRSQHIPHATTSLLSARHMQIWLVAYVQAYIAR